MDRAFSLRFKQIMKFDPDIVRQILLDVESISAGTFAHDIKLQGQDPDVVIRHIQILVQEEFIDGRIYLNEFGIASQCTLIDLSYKGHQFLEIARSNTTWNKAKKSLKEKGIGMTINFLQEILVKFATSEISG